jgi:hypothetical protein
MAKPLTIPQVLAHERRSMGGSVELISWWKTVYPPMTAVLYSVKYTDAGREFRICIANDKHVVGTLSVGYEDG